MAKSKKTNQALPILLTLCGFVALSAIIALLLRGTDVILFNPKGMIANEQHRLMVVSTLIMLVIGVPTLFALYYFAWRYREGNNKAAYHAHSKNRKLSSVFIWGVPTIFMLILASLMVPATHKLAPKRAIASNKDTMTIQVVALRWKWLFIYPEQNIATVNFVQIPVDTPVAFELTADETPMSSFWIPHLGGMLYAMTEHVNQLNLIAEDIGDYEGSAAEINGTGFAGMRFTTRVSSEADFDKWVGETAASSYALTPDEYDNLLVPSKNNPAAFYSNPGSDLYSTIIGKYAGSSHEHGAAKNTEEHGGH